MMHDTSKLSNECIDREERFGAQTYKPLDVVISRASDIWLWDVEGKRYIDCVSAYSAVNQGHCHPRIAAALEEQARALTLTSRAMYNDRLGSFLQKLTSLCGFEMAIPMNTGVEAVETAIKLARRWGYRVKGIPKDAAEIIVFSNNFHGRTMAAIGASSTEQYRADFGPFAPGFVMAAYDEIDAIERAITPNTCAILIEPIQGEGGVIVPPDGFLAQTKALCAQRNVLFIADEIQTGLGRTGDLFACDRERVIPDILILGKALGGGYYPVSAVLASAALMHLFGPGDHGSTFGGNPLAAAIGEAAIDVIVDEDLPRRARQSGATLMTALAAARTPRVREIRGRGLLIGIELDGRAAELSAGMLRHGVVAKDTHETVLRIAPPLTIDDEAIAMVADAFAKALTEL